MPAALSFTNGFGIDEAAQFPLTIPSTRPIDLAVTFSFAPGLGGDAGKTPAPEKMHLQFSELFRTCPIIEAFNC
ncbi:hypothetical protein Q0O37_13890, partial [Staphylococcus aureus]|nr:hypothetical protein [Staphylococcus aureus]